MSYIAFATNAFQEVTYFYGHTLGFAVVDSWDRATGRGRRFDLGGGLRLEILDNARERNPFQLSAPGDRTHVVVEVEDINLAHSRLRFVAPTPLNVSWGARLFQIRDPDGVPVTFLQWMKPESEEV